MAWLLNKNAPAPSDNIQRKKSRLNSASTSGGSGTAVTPDNYLVSPQIELGGSMTFYAAARMSNYPAEKFSVLVSESGNTSASNFTHTLLTVTLSDNSWNEYTVDLSAYSGMGYVAIRHYDCNDQHLLYIDDVTIVEGGEPSNPSNPTTDLLTANVYVRLKGGLAHGTYANETLSVTTGSVTANVSLSGEVNQPEQTEQTVTLNQGWNWWAPTVETSVEAVQTALGSNLQTILSDNGEAAGELVPGQMVRIRTSATCDLTVSGTRPDVIYVTLASGYNWMGFAATETMDVAEVFAAINPVEGDKIISQDEGFAIFNGEAWVGTLTNLHPGQGYVYISNASGTKTLSF